MSDKCFNGLTTVNVELTSRCNKACWMCGRRKIDKDYPQVAMEYGDMDFSLVEKIAKQLPDNIVVQLHDNGEPLLYPRFKDAAQLFSRQIVNIVTNGKLLVEKADEIIDVLDTIAISIFEKDDEADEQYEIIEEFLKLKGERKPYTILRINGDVDVEKYEKFGLVMASRILHAPMGSFNYKKKEPTVPEVGMCLDFLNHMAVNRKGDVSVCVRFDPKGLGVIDNVKKNSLLEIWNSPKRRQWLEAHKKGKRQEVPLCSYCHFWGVPTGTGENISNIKGSITDKDVIEKQTKEK